MSFVDGLSDLTPAQRAAALVEHLRGGLDVKYDSGACCADLWDNPGTAGAVAAEIAAAEARGRAAALAAFRALLDATTRDAINTGAREVQHLCRELKAGAERAVGG